MKNVFLKLFCLAILLILAGCSGSNQSLGNIQNEDFFSKEIEGELTVSVYDSYTYRTYLEQAALEFAAHYPKVKVTIEYFSAMPEMRTAELDDGSIIYVSEVTDDPQSRADYISRTNTKIMSGAGADIYAMDILPLHRLVAGGALENLDTYMQLDPEFNKSDYRQNILDALRNIRGAPNGTWFMPLDYNFNIILYNTTLVPNELAQNFGIDKAFNTQMLLDIGMSLFNSCGGIYKVFNIADRSIFDRLVAENIRSFVNWETGRANFIDGSFAGLLDSVRRYSAQGVIPKGMPSYEEMINRQYFTPFPAMILLLKYGGMMANIGMGDDNQIAGIASNADGTVPFTYNRSMAINSQSKNKLTAWAFIKFLLSEEMQTSPSAMGAVFPINNKASYEWAEYMLQAFAGEEMNDRLRQALDNYTAAVEIMSDNINCFVMQDSSLNDMISQEVQYFFDGSRSAEEVARVLQNKADLYLSE